MVLSGASYAFAESQCSANNMKLFVIENAAVQTAFLEYNEVFFAAEVGPIFWINGRKDGSGVWTSTNPTQPIFSGMKYTSGTATPTEAGNCLTVGASATNSTYYVRPGNCVVFHWFYCEYV
jgi:hypothetical protein